MNAVSTTGLKPADTPTQSDLAADVKATIELAAAIKIDSPVMYEMAGDALKEAKSKIKALEDRRMLITRPMDAAKKEVMALFAEPIDKLKASATALTNGILAYDREQDAIRRAEAAKAEAAAEAARAQLVEQAQEAEAAGDVGTAMTLAATADMVVAQAPATPAPTKLSGVASTTRWSAEVTDKVAYIKHVLDHPELIDSIEIVMKPLNQMAVAMKDKLNLPGIKAVANTGLAVRG